MRYAIGVEYDGSAFRGWQRLTQPGMRDEATVQGVLETALSSVADARIETVCAGRTDAGVHAQCQVAHFDSDAGRDLRADPAQLVELFLEARLRIARPGESDRIAQREGDFTPAALQQVEILDRALGRLDRRARGCRRAPRPTSTAAW